MNNDKDTMNTLYYHHNDTIQLLHTIFLTGDVPYASHTFPIFFNFVLYYGQARGRVTCARQERLEVTHGGVFQSKPGSGTPRPEGLPDPEKMVQRNEPGD